MPMLVPEFAYDAAGRPKRATDATGHEAWVLRWEAHGLAHARLRLPDGSAIELHPRSTDHLVLGVCDGLHLVPVADPGRPLARISAVSWAAPVDIPAVDVPGALPPGAGTAVLNLLAVLARHAGTASLRYRGPYPTSGLFATLGASFSVDGDRVELERRFVGAAERHGFGSVCLSPEVDFRADPHAWSWPQPGVCVQYRRGIDRVWVEGRPYDRNGEHHVLVREHDEWIARVVFAGRSWCDVLRLGDDGVPRSAVTPAPAVAADLVGVALPTAMVEVLTAAIAAEAAAPLRDAIATELARGITLGDTGLTPAAPGPDGMVLHAGLAERALELPAATSIATLAIALRAVVVRAAVARLAAALAAR